MKNTLQINYWTLGGFDGAKPIPQALAEAAKMGYGGVELTFGAGYFAPGISEKECKEYARAAKDLGLKIESVASGTYWGQSLSDPSAAVRKKAVAYTKDYLRAAKWVGAKTILVVPGAVAVPWDDQQPIVPYAEVWKNSTASLKQVLPLAKSLGVTIGVENVWNWFLADPVAMKTFVDQFKSNRIGVYLDVANCAINGYAEHWIEILGKRVAAVHIKNFSRSDCAGVLHGFGDDLLKGDVRWNEVTAALKKIKYTGPLTAEMIPFSRLPNLTLPDMKLAKDTAGKLRKLFQNA